MPVVWTEYHQTLDTSEPEEYAGGCYGFVNGTLYLGDTHHALILAGMVNGEYPEKFTWEQLAAAKQVWGWYEISDVNNGNGRYDYNSGRYVYDDEKPPRYVGEISFASDDAKQTYGLKAKLVAAFKEAYPGVSFQLQKDIGSYGQGGTTQTDYGARAREQYLEPEEDYDPDYY